MLVYTISWILLDASNNKHNNIIEKKIANNIKMKLKKNNSMITKANKGNILAIMGEDTFNF